MKTFIWCLVVAFFASALSTAYYNWKNRSVINAINLYHACDKATMIVVGCKKQNHTTGFYGLKEYIVIYANEDRYNKSIKSILKTID